jgi:hypothetical protein
MQPSTNFKLRDYPPGIVTMIEAKRRAFEALPSEQQEAVREAQRAARERAFEKRAASKKTAQTIYSMLFDGARVDEIAKAVGRSIHAVRQTCARWGFPISRSLAVVTLGVTVCDRAADALDRAAADYGATRVQMVEDLLAFALADDAFILRRTLRVTRKATT